MDELEHGAESQGELSASVSSIGRPSVLHLMLWTLYSAVYLTVIRAIHILQGDAPVGVVVVQQTSGLIYSIIFGAQFTGATVLVVARIRGGPPLLKEPGHWLLMIAALLAVIYMPMMLILFWFSEQFGSGQWLMAYIGIVFLIQPIAFAFAAKRFRVLRWRLLFAVLALMSLSQSILYLGMGISSGLLINWIGIFAAVSTWGGLLLAPVVLIVALAERIQGQRRDWLHWTGVITHVASNLASIIWMLV